MAPCSRRRPGNPRRPAGLAEVVGLLLAAGQGRRFGRDKRWATLHEGPMALVAARQLVAACREVIVVVGEGDEALSEAVVAAGCRAIVCVDAAQGMGHSLAAGVRARRDAAGWLVALADMPFVRPETHRVVRDALLAGASVARACHGGRPGHPVGFDARWGDSLAALTGDVGARELVRRAGAARVDCEVPDPGCLRDVDRPADLPVGDVAHIRP
ncbi:MAG: nucleotidyltransferase family protein [Rhodocyclaceae bacterium]|nr:nucleotidyltransferase family protein [Rhodocyclaceae bacterium]